MRTIPQPRHLEILMRATLIAFALAAALPACRGAVIEGAEATSTGSTTASSSTTSGAGGAAPSPCTFTVSGAISQAVATPGPAFSIGFIAGTTLSCGGGIEGTAWNSLLLSIEQLHGPGVYTTSAGPGAVDGYQFNGCGSNGLCTVESFGDEPDSMGCTMVLTEAPTAYVDGAPVEGTFSCPELVDDADASRRVAISGTFSAVVMPAPQ